MWETRDSDRELSAENHLHESDLDRKLILKWALYKQSVKV